MWSTLQLKTDRRETEKVRNREGEGRHEGTPALLRKTPSVFPSFLSPLLQWRVLLESKAKRQCEADVRSVHVSEGDEKEKARLGQIRRMVSCQSSR